MSPKPPSAPSPRVIPIAPAALRHRVVASFEADADGVTSDEIVARLLRFVPREERAA